MTARAYRRQAIHVWILAIIAGTILMAFTGCKKNKPFRDHEPKPADLEAREWTKKLVYPQHGEGCDTTLHGKY